MRRCEDVRMWGCEDVMLGWEDMKMRRCEDEKMWGCEDEKIWRCEDVKMRRSEDEKMWRCEDEQMWRWEDVNMWGCEDEKMWRCVYVKMWGCEDEKMWRWEGVKMRRYEDEKIVKMIRWDDVWQTPTIGRTLRSDALGNNRQNCQLLSCRYRLPVGKRLHNYGKSPCYQWVNPLFLSSFSMSQTVSHYERVTKKPSHHSAHHGKRPWIQGSLTKTIFNAPGCAVRMTVGHHDNDTCSDITIQPL